MLHLVLLAVCVGFTLASWKDDVLNKHNALRSKVATGRQSGAPTAAYMAKLVSESRIICNGEGEDTSAVVVLLAVSVS